MYRMLDMGFEPQLERIVAYLPSSLQHAQTLMFSATFRKRVKSVAAPTRTRRLAASPTTGPGKLRSRASRSSWSSAAVGPQQDKFPALRDVVGLDQ